MPSGEWAVDWSGDGVMWGTPRDGGVSYAVLHNLDEQQVPVEISVRFCFGFACFAYSESSHDWSCSVL